MNPRLVYARYVGAPVQLLEYNDYSDLEFPAIPTLQYDNLISIRLNGMTRLNIKTSQIFLFQTRLGIPQKLVCVYDIYDYEILQHSMACILGSTSRTLCLSQFLQSLERRPFYFPFIWKDFQRGRFLISPLFCYDFKVIY